METEPKRSHCPGSAEIIAGNDDLLTELILVRLPATSLVRFKSVCKHWRSLISSPFFTHHHARRNKPLPSFLLRTSAASEFFYFNPTARTLLPFKFQFKHTRILQSSHGLLLLEHRNSPYARRNYCVYNPTTGQSRHLDIAAADKKTTSFIHGLSLYFDPSKSPYYKVICFRRTSPDSDPQIEIYDSQFRNWEKVTTVQERRRFTYPTTMQYWNGIVGDF